jgi:hypothetical protein
MMPVGLKGRLLIAISLLLVAGQTLYGFQNVVDHQAAQSLPVALGTSGGNAGDANNLYCCSGTLGSLVTKNGSLYVLSANHVLTRNSRATFGESILQPGLIDSSCSMTGTQQVAWFAESSQLGTANIDAALGLVVPGAVDPAGTILDIGVPASTPTVAAPHEGVAKSGRTTGLTCDSITSTDATVSVDYTTDCGAGASYTVTYSNQILINSPKFSGAGDSGALIVDSATAQPVGLLFAGSSSITVANPIQDVLSAFNVSMVGGAPHPVACPVNGRKTRPHGTGVSQAQAVKQLYAAQLLQDPAVMAVAVGADDDAQAVVTIYVEQGRAHRDIPAAINGVRTKIYLSDRIRAYGWNEPRSTSCRVHSAVPTLQRLQGAK